MMFIVAWLLVSSSVFLSAFYLSVYNRKKQDLTEDYQQPDEWPSVSILVPAYNEESVVADSVRNLLSLDYSDCKIIFIDDASTDATLEKIEEFRDNERFEVVELDENRGKAGALNAGLEKVESELAVVQDADSVIDSGLLESAVTRIKAEEDAGGVIARIRPLKRDSFIRKLQVVEYMMTNFYRKLMSSINILDVTPGAFSIYNTSDLKELGGFDEGNLTEDLDMAWRLRRKGRTIRMVYGEKSNTELPASFTDLKGQRVRWARGFLYNLRKHLDLLFKSEYGWFSRFHLPAQFMVAMISIAGLGIILYGVAEGLTNVIIGVSSVGLSYFSFSSISLTEMILGFQWKIYAPLALGFAITGKLMIEAYDRSGRKIEHPHGLVFYFFAFFLLKAYFWSTAFFKELFSTTKAWT